MTTPPLPTSTIERLPEAPGDSASRPAVGRRSRRRRADDDAVLQRVASGRLERTLIYLALVVLVVLFGFPLYSAIVRSLEVNGIGNYISLFTEPTGSVNIWQTYLNSFAIGAIHAAIVVTVSALAGYAFSKFVFPGREVGFALVLLFLAVPGIAILVPVYSITRELGLFNSYLGVGLPEAALTIPFGVLLMRNYGRTVSDSMIEAAHLDGAGHFRVFWSVFLPVARPAVVNLTVLCFIWSLQDFLWPTFLFTDPQMATAAQAVQTFANALGRGAADVAKYNASLVLLAVPALLAVLFGLRFIISGLSSGGEKE